VLKSESSLSIPSQYHQALKEQEDTDDRYIRSLPIKPRVQFKTLYPNASPLALDLLAKLLSFDPSKRVGCQESLEHP
jgi:serine/threonine protein kinase